MKPPIGFDGTEPTVGAIKACREYGVQQLDVAMENEIYICGMYSHLNPIIPCMRLSLPAKSLNATIQ